MLAVGPVNCKQTNGTCTQLECNASGRVQPAYTESQACRTYEVECSQKDKLHEWLTGIIIHKTEFLESGMAIARLPMDVRHRWKLTAST